MTAEKVNEFLGVTKFRDTLANEKSEVGLVTGLAWTEVGGSILSIEVAIVDGKGKLTITGQLGDVMQESAHAAMSYVRSRAVRLGIPKDFYRNFDIHIHVPEGAIPKDGPSAGITMATAISSALSKIPVRRDIAMTGEITLRGKVLPIGGLKEKLLAALRAGIKEAIIPKENEKDLADVPENIRGQMKVHLVENMDQVSEGRAGNAAPGLPGRRRTDDPSTSRSAGDIARTIFVVSVRFAPNRPSASCHRAVCSAPVTRGPASRAGLTANAKLARKGGLSTCARISRSANSV